MSRGPERAMWAWLGPLLRRAGVRTLRVENMLDDGFPDVVLQHPATHLTLLELKARSDLPSARALALGKAHGLRQSQKNWWLEYVQAGGHHGYIATRCATSLFVHSAGYADVLNTMPMAQFRATAITTTAAGLIGIVTGEGS